MQGYTAKLCFWHTWCGPLVQGTTLSLELHSAPTLSLELRCHHSAHTDTHPQHCSQQQCLPTAGLQLRLHIGSMHASDAAYATSMIAMQPA